MARADQPTVSRRVDQPTRMHTMRILDAFPLFLLSFYYLLLLLAHGPLVTTAMANKAKPLYLKKQEWWLKKEDLLDRAVNAYRTQAAKPGTRQWKGYRTIAVEIMDQYEEETKSRSNPRGERININWTTIRSRDEGTRSLLDARAQDALLTPDEDHILTEFLQESADRGFPANSKRIIEAALEIIQKRRPEIKKLSHHWLSRFLNRKKARKELQVYWSKSLKTDRGRAINPTTHREYFRLLQQLFEEYEFSEDCIWGGDESAFQKGQSKPNLDAIPFH
jgi:hypothetical protein